MLDSRESGKEGVAWIDGAPASLENAIGAASRLLARSRQALLAGLGTDIEGTRAAVALAEKIGGVVDHVHSTAMLRDLDCLRETGVMTTTPGEAHVRADTVLLVGEGLVEAWPALCDRLLMPAAGQSRVNVPRRIVWLASAPEARLVGFAGELDMLAVGRGAERASALAALRARIKGRRIASSPVSPASLDRIAETLTGARFGVAVWSAASLDALDIETLNGLVRDLNETTRFTALPLAPPDNGTGVLAACGWMTGFPMRTGFGSGAPVHDPWRFETSRLISSGETDCVLWISALSAQPHAWKHSPPAIALCDAETRFGGEPSVRIAVGRPGVDHDAILHNVDTGTLVAVAASAPSGAPSVAMILQQIARRLNEEEAHAC
jgi:formylmethanofuran dehydrogenase subunit B